MTHSRHHPVEVTLHSKQRMLAITFDNGAYFELPCEYLRVYSPSSEVQAYHSKRPVLQLDKEDVNITEIKQVGHYAIKFFFNDKHKSGLFTWDYLYDLGSNRERHWQDYLKRLQQAGHQRKTNS